MERRKALLTIVLLSGLIATAGVVLVMAGSTAPAQADTNVIFVAPGGNCAGATPCYENVQAAVDAASEGDLVKVATGIYTGVESRPVALGYPSPPASNVITQAVYISKTVTVRGGYTIADWSTFNPISYPTTLDAQKQGRVLYITGNINPTIEGLRLIGGNAAGLGGSPSGDSGGGILVVDATVTMSHSQVISNVATFGGGLYFYRSPNTMLIRTTVRNNQGWTHAGGLYFRESPTATLVSNVVNDNVSDHQGGGMKHYGGMRFDRSHNATLISNTISGNYAANTCGGACFGSSNNVTLISNTIISNTARQQGFVGNGAGLYFWSSRDIRVLSNTIMYNGAQGDINVGSIAGGGVFINSNTSGVLLGNVIGSNEATTGGGLYLANTDDLVLSRNVIIDNHATLNGGGIQIFEAAPTLSNNRIISNVTSDDGGGIFVDDNSSPTLVNNVIARNRADSNGGAIYIDFFSTPTITNNTIVSNSKEAIFLFNTPSPIIVNNIIATHTYGICGAPLTITLDYNDVWSCSSRCYSGVDPGPHDISANPRFVSAADDNYHLLPNSPAIDAGTDVGAPTTDFDGEPRPLDGNLDGVAVTDMGVDEFLPNPSLVVTKRADPDPVLAGAPLTYTLRVTNNGNVTLSATITDILPQWVTPTGVLTWTAVIPAPGDVWTESVVVTIEEDYVGPLINVVWVATAEGATGSYRLTSSVAAHIYLPLVLRNY